MKRILTILLLVAAFGADAASRKFSELSTVTTVNPGTAKVLLHEATPANKLITPADLYRTQTNNTLATTNFYLYGSGSGAVTLFDSDADKHARIVPTAATTTNVNLVLPAAPYTGFLLSTLSDATNSTLSYVDSVGAGKVFREFVYEFALGDETNAIATGTSFITWRAPWAFTVTAVRASVSTASSSGLPTVDINEGGSTILSTKLTIDANEKTSTTAANAAVISDTAIADDAEITFDIDTAGTGAKGLKVKIYGYR